MEVSAALGPPGSAYVETVPVASAVLQTYAAAFVQPDRDLDDLVTALSDARAGLV